MFGKGVTEIISSWLLKESELLLLFSILQPVIFIVYTFGAIFSNGAFDEFLYYYIVDLYRCRRLGMAYFDEGVVYNSGILSIFEYTSSFVFSSRGNDIFEDFTKGMDRTIKFGFSSREVGDEVTEKEVAAYSTFSIEFNKVCSIAIYL